MCGLTECPGGEVALAGCVWGIGLQHYEALRLLVALVQHAQLAGGLLCSTGVGEFKCGVEGLGGRLRVLRGGCLCRRAAGNLPRMCTPRAR
jgi:hypothetical protein